MEIAPLIAIPEIKPAMEQIRGQWAHDSKTRLDEIGPYFAFGARLVLVIDRPRATLFAYDDPATAQEHVAPRLPHFARSPDLHIDSSALFRNFA